MSVALEAVGLGKRYGRNWALHQCSIRLPAGRIAALVGPNGAGKTTLMHLAVGLLRPTEGSIRIFGWSPLAEPDLVLAHTGFLAQDVPLYDYFSVADMLQLGRRLNRRWDQRAAESRLARLGIRVDQLVGRLSGGQRAQVALALALSKRPDFLLLDEPLSTLDPLARRSFLQELMDAASGDSITVLLSSHLISDMERVCDHLVLLNRGHVQVTGGIDELLATHSLLAGPRLPAGDQFAGLEVVRRIDGERQSTLVVRGPVRELPTAWTVSPLPLEELVLAYMANQDAMTVTDLEPQAVEA